MAESFDVNGTPYVQEEDKVALIHQIVKTMIPKNASYNFLVKFSSNDKMSVLYHSHEIDLHLRYKQVDEQTNVLFAEFEKNLKKKYKEASGKTLKMKEEKELRSIGSEKVSVNNRYYYRHTRTYEI